MTIIKRDYLAIDFTLFPNVIEIVEALKEERLKAKYSAIYHTEVLQKILDTMPCIQPHEIKMKIEVIIYLVGTLFQSAKSTFLSRDQWITVHDRVKELLSLSQSAEFIKALKEAHAPAPEKPVVEEGKEEEVEELDLEELERQNRFETERSVFPSLSTFLERMDENLWKAYQKLAANSSSIDYLQRINDENKLLFLID